MISSLIERSRKLMQTQTQKNGAPAWALTEIAVSKGRKLAKKYRVSEELVVASLYLAHLVFSKNIRGAVQKNHEELSARLAEKYLKQWKVSSQKTALILNAIRAHHDKTKTESRIAEVMKNAECFKFITIPGALIYLHDLGTRGIGLSAALQQVRHKARQKMSYISLPGVRREALKSYRKTMKLLDSVSS